MTATDFQYPAINFRGPLSTSWTEELCAGLESGFVAGQRAWVEAKIAETCIRHPEYPHLYKYMSVGLNARERMQTIFAEERIWAASLDKLNDPLEAAFLASSDLSHTDAVVALNNIAHSNWWGCVCFSTDPVCVQMWAHYAAQHAGICVQYRRAGSYLLSSKNCQPISYRRTMPRVEATEQSIHQIFWSKSDAWEYEREWRLMYPRANAYLAPGLVVPSGIVFGLRTPPETKELVRKTAPHMRFGQIVSAREPYRLQIHWEQPDA